MMHALKLIVVAIVGIVLLYVSRFWMFNLWERPGLFGLKELPPQGGLLQRWLRGTDLAPFELLIWFIVGFLALTAMQKIFEKLEGSNEH